MKEYRLQYASTDRNKKKSHYKHKYLFEIVIPTVFESVTCWYSVSEISFGPQKITMAENTQTGLKLQPLLARHTSVVNLDLDQNCDYSHLQYV